jgi:dUTP pyrophosphatase
MASSVFGLNMVSKYSNYAVLKLFVSNNSQELYDLYTKKAKEHNDANNENAHFNAGFDLFVPESTTVNKGSVAFIKMGVKAEMVGSDGSVLSYYMYPRSSISKTPLMVANHVGIIDSGYRGELTGAFRHIGHEDNAYLVEKHNRLMQVCAPSLLPLYVYICKKEEDISGSVRGEGGFGSTGR